MFLRRNNMSGLPLLCLGTGLDFDGYADWEGIARRIHRCGFDGSLTFEVDSKGRCGSHSNDKYLGMSIEQFVQAAYDSAVRFRDLFAATK